jgi:hypothetical protein
MNYFCQLLNVQQLRGQTEIQTAEPSISEVEVAIGKLKRCRSPGADQISAEMIQAGEKHYILSEITTNTYAVLKINGCPDW